MSPSDTSLPIEALRPAFEEAWATGPVVVSAPTGSGKSTRVPTWCLEPVGSRVLVVEPRRVACRSLAQRVAELEGATLGREVGYHVRDDHRAGDDTRLLFATPGVVLRRFGGIEDGAWDTVVLDELHERGLETDLLLALLTRRRRAGEAAPRLVVMSATLAGDRVAEHVGGRHLEGEGRAHPVEVRYLAWGGGRSAGGGRPGAATAPLLPDPRGLEGRVVRALEAAREIAGDVLVFLPGKGEIRAAAGAISGARQLGDLEVLELHGGLSLAEQGRAFAPSRRRKVVLATNVAETSVTLPGIGVVVDSGLVRQTRWYRDRGFLSLVPIAADSATQRAGRAGRTGPGVALRLWDEAAQLEPRTPPEVHRESLTPLVLAAAACGARIDELPFLDPPKETAVAKARQELEGLGAVDGEGRITQRGRRLFGLPLDPLLGRLLVEAASLAGAGGAVAGGGREGDDAGDRDRATRRPGAAGTAGDGESPAAAPPLGADDATSRHRLLEDVVDLVSALAVGGRLAAPPSPGSEPARRGGNPADDPERCDAVALIRAVRSAAEAGGRVAGGRAAAEALTTGRRLRDAFGLPATLPPAARHVDRRALAGVVLAAHPGAVHVARRRGRRVAWAAGGPELELARESAVLGGDRRGGRDGGDPTDDIEAIAVLDTHGVGAGFRDMRLLATCAMPLPLAWLLDAGLGEDRLGRPKLDKGRRRVVASVERVWAGRVLDEREEVPRGELARQATAELFLEGRIFPEALEETRQRLRLAGLAAGLAATGAVPGGGAGGIDTSGWEELLETIHPGGVPELEDWVAGRLAELGVESGNDLALLAADDLTAPEPPWQIASALERDFPLRLELPDASYEMDYAVGRREVTLVKVSGSRKDPPSLTFLPRLPGFTVKVRHGDMLRTLR